MNNHSNSASNLPRWAPVAGVIFGAVTLLFFMSIVAASLFGYVPSSAAKFPTVVVLALGASLAVAFIGGSAAASGRLPLPGAVTHPIEFSVGGGIAVLVIVFLLGSWLYPDAPPSGQPMKFSSSMPFNSGWIMIGYFSERSGGFVEGPYAEVVYRPNGAWKRRDVPQVNDVLMLKDKRNVRIVGYRESGTARELDSPPLANAHLHEGDLTGVVLRKLSLFAT